MHPAVKTRFDFFYMLSQADKIADFHFAGHFESTDTLANVTEGKTFRSKYERENESVQFTGLEVMDQQHLLYYTLIFIWLLPFTFGSEKIHFDILNTCLDGKYHKYAPGVESDLFSQCKPWKERSCCTGSTSKSLHEPLHYNFDLDHCSLIRPLSDECRKHFIQDLCLYECSPNLGPWLVKVNMKSRKERFFNAPLCQNDCSSWYEACKDDYTCNGNWLRGWNWTSEGNKCKENATCQTIKDVFHNSTNFCEKVWDHSWKVVHDDKPCMKIWFDPANGNPNDAVAKYYLENSGSNYSSSIHQLSMSFWLCTWLFLVHYL